MPEERLRAVRRHYELFNRGDLDALLADLDPGVVFEPGDPQAARELGGPRRGRQEVRGYFERIFEHFAHNEVEVVSLQTDGDLVVASVYLHGTWRDTGMSGAVPAVHVFTVDDGRIVRNLIYRQGGVAEGS